MTIDQRAFRRFVLALAVDDPELVKKWRKTYASMRQDESAAFIASMLTMALESVDGTVELDSPKMRS